MLCRILFVICNLEFDTTKIGYFLLSAINSNIFHQKSYKIKDIRRYLLFFNLKSAKTDENRHKINAYQSGNDNSSYRKPQ
jgi:hypothetical protein